MSTEPLKRCAGCHEWKPMEDFTFYAASVDGRYYYCRVCLRARNVARYAANPLPMQAAAAKWRQEHPEAARASHNLWMRAHPAARSKWAARYHEAHPEKSRERRRRRRARTRQAPGAGFTAVDEAAVLGYWDWKCAYCPCDLRALPRDEVHMDHVTPLVVGGAHDPANIVPSCAPCNKKKGPRGIFFIRNGAWHILPALEGYARVG